MSEPTLGPNMTQEQIVKALEALNAEAIESLFNTMRTNHGPVPEAVKAKVDAIDQEIDRLLSELSDVYLVRQKHEDAVYATENIDTFAIDPGNMGFIMVQTPKQKASHPFQHQAYRLYVLLNNLINDRLALLG